VSDAGRNVIQAEALAWMDENPAREGMSVVTSLPDVSELSLDLASWRAWFVGAVARVVRWVPGAGIAIFYQSDVRAFGEWIDKGYLVMRGAEEAGARVIWHKIVCRKPVGTIARGRPSYSHMIAVSVMPRAPAERPGPDVLPDAGLMPWSRAMGVAACRVACLFLRDETSTRTVVDPFCGRGTVLAVANAMGFDAIGVDLSAKRCRAARALVLGAEDAPGVPASAREAFAIGARLFDDGAFWAAHEAWEVRWRVEPDEAERRMLQGLIQIAAAFHQLRVMNAPEAAGRLIGRGLAKLESWPEGFELATFRVGVEACARALTEGRAVDVVVPLLLDSAGSTGP
jgi:hypothetical protein